MSEYAVPFLYWARGVFLVRPTHLAMSHWAFLQSLTAIAKLAPDADIGDGLSVHYSGGSRLPEDVSEWLSKNRIAD